MKKITNTDRMRQIFVEVKTRQEGELLLFVANFIMDTRFPDAALPKPAARRTRGPGKAKTVNAAERGSAGPGFASTV